ncbi:MAG: hypothetical protein Q7T87_07575 [Polaromonas sp.]|nr:hypothetical protein [Polaromonas sp.]
MKTALHTSARTAVLALAAIASLPVATTALAQAGGQTIQTAPADAPATGRVRPDSAIERIVTEDAGTRIDELRVGGETQNITVQPKTGRAPAYEVKPSESARGNPPPASGGETNGSRVWNVFKF